MNVYDIRCLYTLIQPSRDKQSMIPVTIKQLNGLSQEDGMFRLDACDLYSISIMGLLESIEEHSTYVSYRINDGTGNIDSKLWQHKDNSQTSSKFSKCR